MLTNWGQFHKHFTFITYDPSKISQLLFENVAFKGACTHRFYGVAYFDEGISYIHKMFIRLTTDVSK
jgi:hypothetical protein